MSKTNLPQVFTHEQFGNIRCVLIDGTPWFVGKDIATALGYKDTDKSLRNHVDAEDKLNWRIVSSAKNGQKRKTIIINESGLYALIFGSQLESAKQFKRWVTSEVLPSIRKYVGKEWFRLLINKLTESVSATKPKTKCVYVLKMSNDTVKIGVTGNFRERARAVERGSGLTVDDWCHSAYLPSEQAYDIETACHKLFERCRIQGEFFNALFEEVQVELSNFVKITDSKNF